MKDENFSYSNIPSWSVYTLHKALRPRVVQTLHDIGTKANKNIPGDKCLCSLCTCTGDYFENVYNGSSLTILVRYDLIASLFSIFPD